MGHPIQRIPQSEADPQRRAADRARLLERVAVGLAHEGKNPLHNMVLHLQLMAEKLAMPERQGGSPIEKHISSLRDGIARVDGLLRSFGEFAAPEHLPPDLAAAVARALQLFAYEARRASVQCAYKGPVTLLVASDSRHLGDLVAHALVACLELCREGGRVDLHLESRGGAAALILRGTGGAGSRELAQPHLEALRDLAPAAACELQVDTPPAGDARLSLSFLHPR